MNTLDCKFADGDVLARKENAHGESDRAVVVDVLSASEVLVQYLGGPDDGAHDVVYVDSWQRIERQASDAQAGGAR